MNTLFYTRYKIYYAAIAGVPWNIIISQGTPKNND